MLQVNPHDLSQQRAGIAVRSHGQPKILLVVEEDGVVGFVQGLS